jgi:hypothetical protein
MNDADAAVVETAGQPSHRWIDPFYLSDDEHTPSAVWAEALALREVLALVRKKQSLNAAQRMILLRALMKQIPVLLLYRHVLAQRNEIVAQTTKEPNATLYVIVFPGEGKDNTGIKQLNDKVLGYYWCSQFILRRQAAIERLFPVPWDGSLSGFGTVGQDYKTATIVAVGKSRNEFDTEMVKLDAELKQAMLDVLKLADEDPRTPESRKKAIGELRGKLTTKETKTPYRFDYLVGSAIRAVKPDSAAAIALLGRKHTPIDVVYLLLTEALKGAGIARFGVKMRDISNMKSGKKGLPRPSAARKMARSYFLSEEGKGLDPRGRGFDWKLFKRVSTAAQAIRKVLSTPYNRDDPFDRISIYVNGVWTVCFSEFDEEEHRLIAHPDVVRDARKRALGPPQKRDGFKSEAVIRDQSTLLEMWMASLNVLDLIKDFLLGEFRGLLVRYFDRASTSWKEVRDTWGDIEPTRLECVLTRDLRQRADPYPVQGCASEFLFYTRTADQMDRIFFVMDVRDLGVDLLTLYELTNYEILMREISDVKLVERTILASDIINIRKRAAVDAVIAAFRKQHAAGGDWKREEQEGFGSALNKFEAMPTFERSMVVMLGGDEVFVSAHPAYAGREAAIVKDLDARTVEGLPLNMRTAVVYSSARGAPAGASPRQQELNIIAHDQALMLAGEASESLKKLERTHRRIERLIEKLEKSPKKEKQGKAFSHYKSLEALGLMKVFARAKRHRAAPLSQAGFRAMLAALRKGDTAKAKKAGSFELVNFAGKEVNEDKLTEAATKLEELVRADVWPDNLYVQPPTVTKEPKAPKWLKKIIDWFKWIGGADADLDERRLRAANGGGFEECEKVHIA